MTEVSHVYYNNKRHQTRGFFSLPLSCRTCDFSQIKQHRITIETYLLHEFVFQRCCLFWVVGSLISFILKSIYSKLVFNLYFFQIMTLKFNDNML
jgi:hypothetical protein